MRRCTITYECPFYNDEMPRNYTAEQRAALKKKFCGGGNSQCARFIVAKALGLDKVPCNLFPNDLYKINVILGI